MTKRKPLDSDDAAKKFVYEQPETPPKATQPPPSQKNNNIMAKLKTPAKEATIRFTVDLTESMHRKLSMLAAKTGRKKAEIVRMLLDEALTNVDE